MQQPYFRIQDPGDPLSQAALASIAGEHALFSRFAREDMAALDYDETLRRYMNASGMTKVAVERGMFAYNRLRQLPRLRALQDEQRLLDLPRLCAVDTALDRLGPDPQPEVLAAADELLVGVFTPTTERQLLPGAPTVSRRLKSLLGRMNPATDFDEQRRKQREEAKKQRPEETTSMEFYDVQRDGKQSSGACFESDQAVMTAFKLRVALIAREAGISLSQAAERILVGTAPAAKVVLYGFTPVNASGERAPGTPIFLPGEGWTGGDATATIEEWMEQVPAEVVQLDQVRGRTAGGYAPTTAMRAYCVARDGTCIYPGCARPAEQCQLDHRIPFEEGGATTPDNLYCLCQHHHNVKTDRRAFYVPDPETGDIIWLYPDGTYDRAQPTGLFTEQITPENPRWAQTVGARERRKAKNAQFFALGHRILDEYIGHREADRSSRELAELEAAFGMAFEFPFDELPPDLFPGGLDEALAASVPQEGEQYTGTQL